MNRRIALVLGVACVMAGPVMAGDVEARIEALTRSTKWTEVENRPLGFEAFHTQAFARAGDALFLSSVEIIERTRRFAEPQGGYDRDEGKGVGHLFRLDAQGRLTGQITLGEGAIYHPGGIAFDGRWLWVPVGEYRPNSRSIIYRVDPETLDAVEAFRIDDHIGGIVYDPERGTLNGVSWASRRFYTWQVDGAGVVTDAGAPLESVRTPVPTHYIDYQDCELLSTGKAVCTGIAEYRTTPDATPFVLGGIEIVDLTTGRPTFQVPVPVWTPPGRALTSNPVLVEPTAQGLRLTAMPDDGEARLYVYEATLD